MESELNWPAIPRNRFLTSLIIASKFATTPVNKLLGKQTDSVTNRHRFSGGVDEGRLRSGSANRAEIRERKERQKAVDFKAEGG